MKPGTRHTARPWTLGALLFLPGLMAIVAGAMARHGARTNPNDPGPWMLPSVLGMILCLGAVQLVWRRTAEEFSEAPEETNFPVRWTWEFLIGLTAFLWALPWIGFLAATPVFASAMLIRLKVVWWKAIAAAVVLTGAAQGLFVGLFKVPLPSGVWN